MTIFGPLAGSSQRHTPRSSEDPPGVDSVPGSFRAALKQVKNAQPRAEALISEVPAPSQLAPYAVALRAEVTTESAADGSAPQPLSTSREVNNDQEVLATGRIILLHDPAGHHAWDGTFRVVIYIRAELEPEMGNDPLLGSVAWTWLADSLSQHQVSYTQAGGTATRILSESFGSLETRPPSHDVELRASWTPEDTDFGSHVEAWADMVCSFAGLPQLPDGVVALPHIRRN